MAKNQLPLKKPQQLKNNSKQLHQSQQVKIDPHKLKK